MKEMFLLGLCVLLAVGLRGVAPVVRADEPAEADAALKEPVVLTEKQGGIGGDNVTEWSVSVDGKWQVVRYRLDTKGAERAGSRTVERSGTLTEAQRGALAESLKAQRFADLSAELGKKPKVNPHTYLLRLGKETKALHGLAARGKDGPKEQLTAHAAKNLEDKEVGRFTAAAQAVLAACEPKE